MSYKISKELFEAVMGFCKNEVAEIYVSDENISWHTYEDEFIGNKDSKINVDTFFFKCKEYAFRNGYLVTTSQCKDGAYICYLNLKITLDLSGLNKGGKVHSYSGLIRSDSEQQAVFDACQWILDIKDNNE